MRKTFYHLMLTAAVGLLAYSNTFHVPFQFDDFSNITENALIRDPGNFLSSTKGYEYNPRRYIGYLSFTLNYHFGGLTVTGYHVVNLAIHVANALLVYYLVLLIFRTPYFSTQPSAIGSQHPVSEDSLFTSHNSRFTAHFSSLMALFSALLFVSHPLQTQAVTYIVQRFTSLATMFYVLSLTMYIKGRLITDNARGHRQEAMGKRQEDKKIGQETNAGPSRIASASSVPIAYLLSPIAFFFLSLVSAVCAMKTKEIAFTLPVIIVLAEFLFFAPGLKKKLLLLLPVVLTLVVIPMSIIGTQSPLGEVLSDLSEKTRVQTDISRSDYLMTEMRVVTTYIRLIFLPVQQNLDYDYPIYHTFLVLPVILSFLFLLAIFGTALYLLYQTRQEAIGKRQWTEGKSREPALESSYYRLITFGILWFFITLSVESSVIPIADVIFEHRVYLPSVGAFIAIAASLFALAGRLKDRVKETGRIVSSACALIVIALSVTTYARNVTWQDQINLWEDVIRKSPGNARAYNDLGYHYLERGRIDTALDSFLIAIRLNPDYADAYNNLGVAYYEAGAVNEAITSLRTALGISRSRYDIADAHHNLGIAYARKGMSDEALTELEAALVSEPDNPEILNDLGVAYRQKGLIDKAIDSFLAAVRLNPDYAGAHYNLGLAYEAKGSNDKAREHLGRAHVLNPEKF